MRKLHLVNISGYALDRYKAATKETNEICNDCAALREL
jgi:hypothetical protein